LVSLNSVVKSLVSEHPFLQAESAFKALGVALRQAISLDAGAGVPSTKGMLK